MNGRRPQTARPLQNNRLESTENIERAETPNELNNPFRTGLPAGLPACLHAYVPTTGRMDATQHREAAVDCNHRQNDRPPNKLNLVNLQISSSLHDKRTRHQPSLERNNEWP